jgi:uroporphyrinogen-III synthase
MLAGGGAVAELQPIYESVQTGVDIPQALDGVLIHSPKAARAVAKMLSRDQASGLTLFAISPAAAAPLAATGFSRVAVAPRPNESALLDLIAG